MDSISRIYFNDIEWINIDKKGKEELKFLKKGFNFLSTDLEECYKDTVHPAIFVRADYAYFEMLFPVYNRKTQLIENCEINFFIKNNVLLTVHNNELPQLEDFFHLLENDEVIKRKHLQNNPIMLLSGIFDYLLNSYFPMLNHMNEDVITLEKSIFAEEKKFNTRNILKLRWNIVNFKRTIESHKNIIEHLILDASHLFSVGRLKIYYNELIDKIKDITGILENQKESISALEQTNNSLISFELNDVMKTLAIISAVMMPPAFITSLFGVNAKIPYINNPIFFFAILGSCICIILFFLIFFKKRKWL